ncbi:prephenate dehydratase domain-containing protein [Vibrio sp. 10N.261.54.E10]|uniref:prephenate dehydratase domain-containing protein n=1 Tax=Vibrio sp. 10N.261.54.E10 TaxID=1884475 RepID=UPI0039A5C288
MQAADAMKKVKELDGDDVAAIGNASSGVSTACSLSKAILQTKQENHTRFIVVARKPVEVSTQIPAKTTLIMSTSQEAGSLVETLLILQRLGINMTKLESRPIM